MIYQQYKGCHPERNRRGAMATKDSHPQTVASSPHDKKALLLIV